MKMVKTIVDIPKNQVENVKIFMAKNLISNKNNAIATIIEKFFEKEDGKKNEL